MCFMLVWCGSGVSAWGLRSYFPAGFNFMFGSLLGRVGFSVLVFGSHLRLVLGCGWTRG